jgi:transcriptional regulator with XRE-family HTH domain
MDDARLGRLIRVLRHRRGWRQEDLAHRAGVGPRAIGRLESGRLGPVQVSTVRAVVATFGLSYEGRIRGLGAGEDRLLDQRHATLVGGGATWLVTEGWETRSEITYSEWGERGSVDLLGWHPPTASLLVIEVKTELASIEATLRKLDEKVRLAEAIVRQFGWRPKSVSRLLILPDDTTQRRQVRLHASVLDVAYPVRTRAVRTWCRAPSGSIAGLMFLTPVASGRRITETSRRARIRSVRG